MTKILRDVQIKEPFDKNLEYEVKREEETYVAGVRQARYHLSGNIFGDLYADRKVELPIKVWTPKFPNLFHTISKTKTTIERGFYIANILLTPISFKAMVRDINKTLFQDSNKGISFDAAEALFLRAYEYYKQFEQNWGEQVEVGEPVENLEKLTQTP